MNQCQNCKNTFEITDDDKIFYQKRGVDAPTFCPSCRLQRRLAWRNERTLYRRKCGLCGADTITMYREGGGIASYCSPCWWSDKWNPLDYGRAYDFSKPFFVQFRELMERVPHPNLSVSYKTLVASDYNNMNHYLKNCYLLFNSDYDENCAYGEEVERTKDSFDITMVEQSQLIYGSLNVSNSYQVFFSSDIESSHDIWFSKNLANSANCFGCVNLRNKQYCLFNQQYPKEEWAKEVAKLNAGSYAAAEKLKQKAAEFAKKFPRKYMHGKHNEKVSGDYIYNSKKTFNSFIVTDAENCKYCTWLISKPNKDCYDFTQFGENIQQSYEASVCGKGVSDLIGGISVIEGRAVRYSAYCFNNNANIFGCIGLRSLQYCILNKQYTEEEYKELAPKIIKHMNDMPYIDSKGRTHRYGDFFPIELSHFGYNETSAYEYFPLEEVGAKENGFKWSPLEEKNYKISLTPADIPDAIVEPSDSLLNEIIGCAHAGPPAGGCKEQCTTAFRLIPAELEFLKKNNLPLPRLCPNCRHYERIKDRNPMRLWPGKCGCKGKASSDGAYANTAYPHPDHGASDPCPNTFETAYDPTKSDIVYCESCYLAEVV